MKGFRTRTYKKELIDDFHSDGQELRQTLRELKTINRLLGGNHVTTQGIKKLMKGREKSKVVIADVGCGGGDMIRVMDNWAKKERMEAEFIGIDANQNTIEMAKKNLDDLSNVSFETANVFDNNFQQKKLDIITCTLFTHHFTDQELIQMFQSFRQTTKVGLVINDLHRHPLAYYSIKILTSLFSKSRLVKNDAPLSVLRSFHRKEISSLLEEAGWKNIQVSWHWAFRWQVIGFKS
jgi:2-polyprenyl-3-methyl-5-hydroxy-6-metoxy-1,4-benzoquinol methylase